MAEEEGNNFKLEVPVNNNDQKGWTSIVILWFESSPIHLITTYQKQYTSIISYIMSTIESKGIAQVVLWQ